MKKYAQWDTSKKLPFWLRRADVPVAGQAAAEQKAEFNWRLVEVSVYTVGALMIGIGFVLALGAIFGFAVSIVKTFPIIATIVVLALLFKRS